MINPSQPTISRALGKVLIAGGYGVLEEFNLGLSLALENSLYCHCQEFSNLDGQTFIQVRSPQIQGLWQYFWDGQKDKLIEKNNKNNIFVHCAIVEALTFLGQLSKAGTIKLKIVSDRGFISESDAIDQKAIFPKYKAEYSKTGLGSSACVIVCIVKCILQIFKIDHLQINNLVNVISQTANLRAQQKIGSNFDISTAVFGTHLYTNIFPHKIFQILAQEPQKKRSSINKLLAIDPQIRLMDSLQTHTLKGFIVDIKRGADTRKMVTGFLNRLRQMPEKVQTQFFTTSKQVTLMLYQALSKNSQEECRATNKVHRELQQKYSKITGVAIEPEELTPLIDEIMKMDDIWYVICPGSGGYDAIFVLGGKDSKVEQIQKKVGNGNDVRMVNLAMGNDYRGVKKQIIDEIVSVNE